MSNMNFIRQFLLSGLVLFFVAAAAAAQASQEFKASGANPSDIAPAVQQFRTALGGANNGEYNSFTSGYREVSWDDVPDNLAAPGVMNNGGYYNANSPRGLVFASVAEAFFGTDKEPFEVSADNSNPTNTAVRFGNINATYANEFKAYSGERIFAAVRYHEIDVNFRIPGTNIPASVKGFGIVFTDVDLGANTAALYYDEKGNMLGYEVAQGFDKGFSFVGFIPASGKRIARVHLILGDSSLSQFNYDDENHDVVAMDNVIYGEPRATVARPSDFDGDGSPDLTVFRPSEGNWYVFQSGTNTFSAVKFGLAGDLPVDGDFDGDARNDFAVFRPSEGAWYILNSSNGQVQIGQFGLGGDKPVVADYDRDGRSDIAVWRPADGNYYVLQSSNGQPKITHWGLSGDIPILAGGN